MDDSFTATVLSDFASRVNFIRGFMQKLINKVCTEIFYLRSY